MTFTLTFAGVVQTHLQRVIGGTAYMDVQDQLALFYWMRLGAGTRGADRRRAVRLRRCSGRCGSRPTAADVARQPGRIAEAERTHERRDEPAGRSRRCRSTCRRRRECELFEAAFRQRLPLLLKGPTGCGKTRFVAHMAARLGRPLYTVSCHDDLTAADLTGRYLLKGGDTVWVDGPLTRAVRRGRDLLPRRGGRGAQGRDRRPPPAHRRPPAAAARAHGRAARGAARVHARRLLQPRLPEHAEEPEAEHAAALRRDRVRLPPRRSAEAAIVAAGERPSDRPLRASSFASRTRCGQLKGQDLEEGVSTRLLVYCATLMAGGIRVERAVSAAVIEPLTDDPDVRQALRRVAEIGDLGLGLAWCFEPEETVGRLWHRLVGERDDLSAASGKPRCGWRKCRRRLAVVFRALGGDQGRGACSRRARTSPSPPRACGSGSALVERAAARPLRSTARSLQLPPVLDCFPDSAGQPSALRMARRLLGPAQAAAAAVGDPLQADIATLRRGRGDDRAGPRGAGLAYASRTVGSPCARWSAPAATRARRMGAADRGGGAVACSGEAGGDGADDAAGRDGAARRLRGPAAATGRSCRFRSGARCARLRRARRGGPEPADEQAAPSEAARRQAAQGGAAQEGPGPAPRPASAQPLRDAPRLGRDGRPRPRTRTTTTPMRRNRPPRTWTSWRSASTSAAPRAA